MTRAELLQLLAVASAIIPPLPYRLESGGMVPPTPDEWAAHLVTYALALGRAVAAACAPDTIIESDREHARRAQAPKKMPGHRPECEPFSCDHRCALAARPL